MNLKVKNKDEAEREPQPHAVQWALCAVWARDKGLAAETRLGDARGAIREQRKANLESLGYASAARSVGDAHVLRARPASNGVFRSKSFERKGIHLSC